MRLTLMMLGHTLDISLDAATNDDGPGEREGQADALVERSDGRDRPAFGFAPSRTEEDV